MSVRVVDGDLVTAYGVGFDACWDGLLHRRSAVKPLTRFSTDPFQCHSAATLDGLTSGEGDSIVWQMLTRLLVENDPRIPPEAPLFLASTTGEIDFLEQGDAEKSKLSVLLEKLCSRLDGSLVGQASCIQEPVLMANKDTRSRIRDSTNGREASLLRGNAQRKWQPRPTIKKRNSAVISSACASSTVAIAQAAAQIERGECDCAVVVACDAVSEFVYSGFASLMALDPKGARPFDADRQGLSVGEAAGFIVLMSAERAEREKRTSLGEVAGWGMSNDANHMTGPSRDGGALALAIETSLARANISSQKIAAVCAHGTGTQYNDSMELKAFKTVFPEPKPIFSVKGGTGHTMGAAGLVEALLTLKVLRKEIILPTVSLDCPDVDAEEWVSSEPDFLLNCEWALTTNSGFGGVNAALVLRRVNS